MSLAAWPEEFLPYLLTVARSSALSQVQVKEAQTLIAHFYPQVKLEALFVQSRGDVDKTTSLRKMDRTDFFTDRLDHMLASDQAFLAVHSAKDLPSPLHSSLEIAALTPCIDSRDALVFANSVDLSLPFAKNLRVATSSTRREAAVQAVLPQPKFQDLRGTIHERLELLQDGRADAVVIAEAALIRLSLTHLPRVYLPGETTPGQGSLALVTHKKQKALIEALSCLDTRVKRPHCLYLGIDPKQFCSPFSLKHCPVITTKNLLEHEPSLTCELLKHFKRANHILITSPRAATYLWNCLIKAHMLDQAEEKIWLCIGPSTSLKLGPQAKKRKICSEGASAEEMLPWIEGLKPQDYVLYPHSRQSRPLLKHALEKRQIPHASFEIYHTHESTLEPFLPQIYCADELIFTSPSCVRSFFSQVDLLPQAKLTAIGQITMRELQKYQQARYTANKTFAFS